MRYAASQCGAGGLWRRGLIEPLATGDHGSDVQRNNACEAARVMRTRRSALQRAITSIYRAKPASISSRGSRLGGYIETSIADS
jgi:hypothetical protein